MLLEAFPALRSLCSASFIVMRICSPASALLYAKAQAKALPHAPVQSASSVVDRLSFVNGIAEVKVLLREASENVTKRCPGCSGNRRGQAQEATLECMGAVVDR